MPDRQREKQREKQLCRGQDQRRRMGMGKMCSRHWSKVPCSLWGTHTRTGFFLKDCSSRRSHIGAGKTHEREVWAEIKTFTWTIAPPHSSCAAGGGGIVEFGVWSEAECGEGGKKCVVSMFLFDSFYSNLF